MLPNNSPFVTLKLHECHDTKVRRYLGFLKTYKRVVREVFWQGMNKRVKEYVAECEVYQKNKYLTLSLAGLLQPLLVPELVW